MIRNMVRKRRKTILLLLFFLSSLSGIIGYATYRFFHPSLAVMREFESPTGMRCILRERPPPGFMVSPHEYRFELIDSRGRAIPGDFEFSTDSAGIGNDCTAHWSQHQLVLRWSNGAIAICNFGSGVQQWEPYPTGLTEEQQKEKIEK